MLPITDPGPQPASEAPLGSPNGRALLVKKLESIVQGVVSVTLVLVLTFIALSNYLGWTARLEVVSVKGTCSSGPCQQRVLVAGGKQPLEVFTSARIKPGDQVDVRGTCTPRCELKLTGIWPSHSQHRVPVGGERP